MNINSSNISIVVQGAIDKNMTPKCLKSIRKYLPCAEIILSTWVGSDTEGLDYDLLVLNQDPKALVYNFVCDIKNNFNRQLVSTKNGIEKVTRPYCLKFRSDLIIQNTNFLNYFEMFNARNNDYKIFKKKILCCSIYSREKSCQDTGMGVPTPFHPSDFWMFGLTDDLKSYFCYCPMQTPDEAANWNFKYPNRLPYTSMLWRFAPEQFFCVNWVKKHYPNLQFDDWSDWNGDNIELSNNILYNNFIFLGFKQAGIYSPKHSWAFKNEDKIQGVITYELFQKRYKEYCDNTYVISKHQTSSYAKLKKHFDKLITPFSKIYAWIGEIFSVIFYLFACISQLLKGRNNNDK